MLGYCRFGNFRVTFISRIFDFRIIREVLNSRASIRVVGHFRRLKLGPNRSEVETRHANCSFPKVVVDRIAVHF